MTEYLSLTLKFAASESSAADKLCLRVILISTPAEVRRAMLDLHARGFAEVKHWSDFQPIPNSKEVLSILTLRGIQARK
jgi:hypothetical protein